MKIANISSSNFFSWSGIYSSQLTMRSLSFSVIVHSDACGCKDFEILNCYRDYGAEKVVMGENVDVINCWRFLMRCYRVKNLERNYWWNMTENFRDIVRWINIYIINENFTQNHFLCFPTKTLATKHDCNWFTQFGMEKVKGKGKFQIFWMV